MKFALRERKRSLSYEHLKKQEDACSRVTCKKCLKRGIMHPARTPRTPREIAKLLNLGSKSSIGEVIDEEDAEQVCEHVLPKTISRH